MFLARAVDKCNSACLVYSPAAQQQQQQSILLYRLSRRFAITFDQDKAKTLGQERASCIRTTGYWQQQ